MTRWPAAVLDDPSGVLLGLDFDGTLSPIVDDPTQAYVHPRSVAALDRLGPRLGLVAIVTGRPVDQVLELGGFQQHTGLSGLVVCGQYGVERWDAATGEVVRPERSAAVAQLVEELPAWLDEHGAQHVRIEDKGLAVALHTRGIDPDLLQRLDAPLRDWAHRLGLALEPGRQVMELRSPGSDKGDAMRHLVERTGARTVVYAGDDLGDLPAFDAVDAFRAEGLAGLLACSVSPEQDALVPRSDVVLQGPDDVADWLTELADALEA
ncbi:trehalose phosphatase [Aeromicrobium sp. Root495]|uniref:trehalose-phosphatase n=1 Tax=Aeromicrobium sp. Root495 TaxID=1736550 RepID=UPI0006FDD484|nr:trehalose-phosphatase [Aeromicrobium sp. Root495]KQY60367.1 trehalose phosphatase [Aeromicrobium sp. Root495]